MVGSYQADLDDTIRRETNGRQAPICGKERRGKGEPRATLPKVVHEDLRGCASGRKGTRVPEQTDN
jgi:hypothetical protein